MDNSRVYARFPTTITLVASDNDEPRMMFCYNCQAPNMKYRGGDIVSISPGVPPIVPYTMVRCRNERCPVVFSVLGITGMSDYYLSTKL